MSASYTFPTTDTANDKVAPTVLRDQIAAAALPECLGVVVSDAARAGNGCYTGGSFAVMFTAVLSSAEEATLAALVAAHVGTAQIALIFKASVLAVGDEKAILGVTEWEDLGGVVTSPSYFIPDVQKAIARIVGDCRADGAGAELRIIEDGEGTDPPRVMSASAPIPDTLGGWQLLPPFNTNQSPSEGQHLYRLQGRLNGATSAAVRYTSLTLMEIEL